jgi:hypothetical protein
MTNNPIAYAAMGRNRNAGSPAENIISITGQPQNGTASISLSGSYADATVQNARPVLHNGSNYVAFFENGANAAAVRTSSDNVTWSAETTVSGLEYFYKAAYGDGKFVAIYDVENFSVSLGYGGQIATSTNGTSWTLSAGNSVAESVQSLKYVGNRFVACCVDVAISGQTVSVLATTKAIAVSTNGTSWTSSSLSTPLLGIESTYGNNAYAVLASASSGSFGDRVLHSTTTSSWSSSTLPSGYRWTTIEYGNGVFVVAGAVLESQFSIYGSLAITLSTDLVTWSTPTVFNIRNDAYPAIAFGNGVFVMAAASVPVSASQSLVVYSSNDGQTWVQRDQIAGDNVSNDMAFTNSEWWLRLVGAYIVYTPSFASATFSATATSSAGKPLSYSWQRSVDNGASWQPYANGSSVSVNASGANGSKYRCEIQSGGAVAAITNTATLTVT